MTIDRVRDLYKVYQDADYKYHQYMDQFFTTTINGQIIKEAVKGISSINQLEIEELDKAVEIAKRDYENALEKWISLNQKQ